MRYALFYAHQYFFQKHKAHVSKHKAYILKQVPCISKYMPCIFRVFKYMKNNNLQSPIFCPLFSEFFHWKCIFISSRTLGVRISVGAFIYNMVFRGSKTLEMLSCMPESCITGFPARTPSLFFRAPPVWNRVLPSDNPHRFCAFWEIIAGYKHFFQ